MNLKSFLGGMACLALLACAAPALLTAQAASPPADLYPGTIYDERDYKPMRWMEDWSFLRNSLPERDAWDRSPERDAWDRSPERDAWDRLKYLALPFGSDASLSLGGEARLMGESYVHPFWGADPDNQGYLLQRYLLHADLRLNHRLRFFGQLQSGLISHRVGGPRPFIDRDLLDLQQAFADITLRDSKRAPSYLRLGRQELSFGSGRFVATREGLNLRLAFDGLRLSTVLQRWHVDAFGLRPVRNDPGFFNNPSDPARLFWGVYAWRPLTRGGRTGFDLYYLGLARKQWAYNAIAGNELRHSFGVRWWSRPRSWDFDYEATAQTGSFAGRGIRAWSFATTSGRTFPSLPLKPRFGLRGDITSGDNRTQGRLGTFSSLFAKGNYFGEADLLGPLNLMDLHPSLVLWPHRKVRIINEFVSFWRQNKADGVYDFAQHLVRPGATTAARHVANSWEIDADWEIDRHLRLAATWQRIWAGRFLRQTPPAQTINFGMLSLTYKF